MKLRDRIVELRRVPAKDLLPNPKNWRIHPESQRNALRGMLAEIGIADVLLARQTEHGLMLIDGHARAEEAPAAEWPVLILDVSAEEADKLMAALDPLAELAEPDAAKLDALLREMEWESGELERILTELSATATETAIQQLAEAPVEEPDAEETAEESLAADYHSFQLAVTVAQEEQIRRSIREAKSRYGCETSAEALYLIARDWFDAKCT